MSCRMVHGALRYRFGPTYWLGEQRLENIGSVMMFHPPIWIKTVAWPIQVACIVLLLVVLFVGKEDKESNCKECIGSIWSRTALGGILAWWRTREVSILATAKGDGSKKVDQELRSLTRRAIFSALVTTSLLLLLLVAPLSLSFVAVNCGWVLDMIRSLESCRIPEPSVKHEQFMFDAGQSVFWGARNLDDFQEIWTTKIPRSWTDRQNMKDFTHSHDYYLTAPFTQPEHLFPVASRNAFTSHEHSRARRTPRRFSTPT